MESVLEQKYNNMMGFYHNDHHRNEEDTYVVSEDDEATSSLSLSSSFDGSNISKESSSSSELLDDASSSSSSPRSPNGPLYGLSELMDQLPIKRGLSKFYQGKSQSFTSLARATSLEDLAKKESPYQRRLKACRSYAGGLNNFRSKGAISKKGSSNYKGSSLSNLSCLSRKNSFIITSCRPPLNPRTVHLFE